jgi:hypothetical protein
MAPLAMTCAQFTVRNETQGWILTLQEGLESAYLVKFLFFKRILVLNQQLGCTIPSQGEPQENYGRRHANHLQRLRERIHLHRC